MQYVLSDKRIRCPGGGGGGGGGDTRYRQMSVMTLWKLVIMEYL